MLLWLGFAILTAAVVAALLQPFRHGGSARLASGTADLAVYRDQLKELEAERERGLFTDDEAQSARTEVARRLIRRAEADETVAKGAPAPPRSTGDRLSETALFGLIALIPALSVGLYLAVGSPGLPERPFAAREHVSVENATVAELVGRIEARLREHPEDGKGWDVVAPVYMRVGRYADAAEAYAQAGRILGETAKRLIGFAEATLLAGNGIVSDDVRRAAERILALEPGRAEARIWLALAKEQDGDLAGAAAEYRDLLAGAPADADWRKAVDDRLALVTKELAAGKASPAPVAAGPSPDDVARAEDMTPADRNAFISRMVDGLASRLKQDSKDLGGWLKLARAYKVLGRDGDALAALTEARRNFSDPQSQGQIDGLAKDLGFGS